MTSDEPSTVWTVTAELSDGAGRCLESMQKDVSVGNGRSIIVSDWNIRLPERGVGYVEITARSNERTIVNLYLLFVQGSDGFADRRPSMDFCSRLKHL